MPVFETGAFNHSATLPTINSVQLHMDDLPDSGLLGATLPDVSISAVRVYHPRTPCGYLFFDWYTVAIYGKDYTRYISRNC